MISIRAMKYLGYTAFGILCALFVILCLLETTRLFLHVASHIAPGWIPSEHKVFDGYGQKRTVIVDTYSSTAHKVFISNLERCASPELKKANVTDQISKVGDPSSADAVNAGEEYDGINQETARNYAYINKAVQDPGVDPFFRRILALERSLYTEQNTSYREKDGLEQEAQLATLITILVGLITTVLVSLSSGRFFSETDKAGKWIRIGAIALPAIGTAIAAIVAFYNPSGQLATATATLSNLRQIQSQVLDMSMQLECPQGLVQCKPGDDTRKLLDQMYKRYDDLVLTIPTKSEQPGRKEVNEEKQKALPKQ